MLRQTLFKPAAGLPYNTVKMRSAVFERKHTGDARCKWISPSSVRFACLSCFTFKIANFNHLLFSSPHNSSKAHRPTTRRTLAVAHKSSSCRVFIKSPICWCFKMIRAREKILAAIHFGLSSTGRLWISGVSISSCIQITKQTLPSSWRGTGRWRWSV